MKVVGGLWPLDHYQQPLHSVRTVNCPFGKGASWHHVLFSEAVYALMPKCLDNDASGCNGVQETHVKFAYNCPMKSREIQTAFTSAFLLFFFLVSFFEVSSFTTVVKRKDKDTPG